MPPSISAANSEAGVVALSAPIPGALESVVEADVKPVIGKPENGGTVPVLFEPSARPKILSTNAARRAAIAFHRAHTPEGFPKDPKFHLLYDEPSGDVIVATSAGGFYVTSLEYQVSLNGTLKAVWLRRWMKGE